LRRALLVGAVAFVSACRSQTPVSPAPTPTATAAPTATPTARNEPPVLGIKLLPSSDPLVGPAPLRIFVNMCFCSDKELDPLEYEFHYNNSDHHKSSFCREEHFYQVPGTYRSWFCVSDPVNEPVCQGIDVQVQ
jgi:hypothetical protein